MAAGPLCSDIQQRKGAEPLLQEALPLADVRRIAGADARRREEGFCPRRSSRRWRNSASAAAESSCETISQRWLLLDVVSTSLFPSASRPSTPPPAPNEGANGPKPPGGGPPRQRTAPFGPGSTAPRSASGGRGGHIDFGKRCFWVALPAGVWSRATTEWIEALGAGLTALNGNPNHVDYAANCRRP